MSVPQSAEKDWSTKRRTFLGPRVPPTLFGIVLGIAGLAGAWQPAVPLLGTAQAVPDALRVLDAALWLVLVGAYLAQGPRIVAADLRDPVLSPFVPASALTAMLLAAALAKDAFTAGRVLVIVFLAVTIGLGGADRPVDERGDRAGFGAHGLLPADRRRRADRRGRCRRLGLGAGGAGAVGGRDHPGLVRRRALFDPGSGFTLPRTRGLRHLRLP